MCKIFQTSSLYVGIYFKITEGLWAEMAVSPGLAHTSRQDLPYLHRMHMTAHWSITISCFHSVPLRNVFSHRFLGLQSIVLLRSVWEVQKSTAVCPLHEDFKQQLPRASVLGYTEITHREPRASWNKEWVGCTSLIDWCTFLIMDNWKY